MVAVTGLEPPAALPTTSTLRRRRPSQRDCRCYPGVTPELGKWSGRLDSNQRPPAPKAGALPGCATPRQPQPHHCTAPESADSSASSVSRCCASRLIVAGQSQAEGRNTRTASDFRPQSPRREPTPADCRACAPASSHPPPCRACRRRA